MSPPVLRKRQSRLTTDRTSGSSSSDNDHHDTELNNNTNGHNAGKRLSLQRQQGFDFQTSKDGALLQASNSQRRKSRNLKQLIGTFILYAAALLIVIYLASPVIFRNSLFIQRSLLFMNFVNLPLYLNLSQPELIGLKCTRALQLQNQDIHYGLWHILPGKSLDRCHHSPIDNRTSIDDTEAFADDAHIILYVHGNGGSRGGNHRRELYQILAYQHNYHVVTFDYRGYADSANALITAPGLNEDTKFIYHWLLQHNNVSPGRVTVWGHSLGTGVSTRMVAELPVTERPSSLVLEAPFDTIGNAIGGHPFSAPFRILPYFEYYFVDPLMNSEQFHFDSAKRIRLLKDTPIIIMHAEDDSIIPYELGHNLYKIAADAFGKDHVKFVSAKANLGLGHKHLCRNDAVMRSVTRFIDSYKSQS